MKLHIAQLVMEAEMQNKHFEKKELKNEMKRIGIQVKHSLGLILYNDSIYQINKATIRRLKAVSLRKQQKKAKKDEQKKIHRQVLHNYRSYKLSDKQYDAFSFGVLTHIPVKVNKHTIYTEFEVFYQSLLKDISNILENDLRQN